MFSCREARQLAAIALVAGAVCGTPVRAADSANGQQSVDELRNTVVNLLQALVDKGLISRDQAQQLVKQAQDKAAADAAATAARGAAEAKADQDAVRVPYVPQVVKDEISKQVAQQVQPTVVASVIKQARDEKWGIPGALPEWLSRVRVYGDVTVRGQADMYPRSNSVDQLLDFNAINQAGDIANLTYPFLNTYEDRDRLRLRARLGAEAQMAPNWVAGIRLASGSLTDPSSESQTQGTYSARYSVAIDRGYIRWNSSPMGTFSGAMIEGGRYENPWFAPTELVYARDLQFEGVASTLGWRLSGSATEADPPHLFASLGAIPVLEVPYQASENKWLLGAQLGASLHWGAGADGLRVAGAYYDFLHVTGIRNTPDSVAENPTAPAFIRYGNTVVDIANSTTNPNLYLFGLASRFRLADLAASYELRFSRYSLGLTGEAVRNLGYSRTDIQNLTGETISSSQNRGYVGELSFGDPIVLALGQWRARVGYRYVQSDAVIDAWTDADFHEGGTNAMGYYLWTDIGLARNVWTRLRYLSSNEVTGPRYANDIVQMDVNASF
jgi:hypothetical protein